MVQAVLTYFGHEFISANDNNKDNNNNNNNNSNGNKNDSKISFILFL